MSRPLIEKVTIDKHRFLEILKDQGYTITGLAQEPEIGVNEKTIRRGLDSGYIGKYLLNRIALYTCIEIDELRGVKDYKFQFPNGRPYRRKPRPRKNNRYALTWEQVFDDFCERHPILAKQVLHWEVADILTIKILTRDWYWRTYNYETKELIVVQEPAEE